MDFVRFGAGLGLHAPESAGAVDVPPVGNEENLITIARPDWTDLVIELAVVIKWQIGGSLSSQVLHVPEFTAAEIGDLDIQSSLRSEENSSELQSRPHLACLLLFAL